MIKSRIRNSGKRLAMCMMLLAMVNVFNGCKEDEEPAPTGPGANEVWMQNNKFNPASLTITVNTTVTWTNKDAEDHNVISDTTGLFTSPTIPANGTYSKQFTTAGTFPYSCTLHANMNGTITVQ